MRCRTAGCRPGTQTRHADPARGYATIGGRLVVRPTERRAAAPVPAFSTAGPTRLATQRICRAAERLWQATRRASYPPTADLRAALMG
ncbi:hypothetical protein GCM10023205_84050 [Yinghuangia aomiensis]|uniref:Uncharacterized protein n=1 Tax=Yinghuangia aomiensis TaxID=676205 RepID=A0ABP9IGS6_9ACTN